MPSPFDEFLSWLSPDREEAAKKYLELRRKLIRTFIRGGCHIPDELVDVTIDRASKKIAEGTVDRSVDPNAYSFGIARNVLREYWKKPRPGPLEPDFLYVVLPRVWTEDHLACFRKCWARLSEHQRNLFKRWHLCEKGREKIEVHKEMAEKEGGINALRVKIHRIRTILRNCIAACLRQEPGNLM
jgi:hypothetical protein